MTKREFIKNMGILGFGSPFLSSLLASCSDNEILAPRIEGQFNGRVLIIGAGAAGLTAGHLLQQQGVDFQILEASDQHGGRVKKSASFVDYPIDLGGEWIHTDPSILAKLNNDPGSTTQIDIITYNPQTVSVWRDGELRNRNIARHFYSEFKFKNSTWFDFFDELMVPHFRENIIYESPVTRIDYAGDQVEVTTASGELYLADKVIITVPISILQADFIQFSPALPAAKRAAINEERMPDGLKVFIEFSEPFYPDILMKGNLLEEVNSSDFTYYNASFGKDSQRHVFALFTVGEKATPYTDLGTDTAIFERVMEELDEIFDGKASQYYVQHVVQNWSQEPFIRGSYSQGWSSPETLAEQIDDRLYFAGEAMAPDGNTSTVHGAAESAFESVRAIMAG
ncbi:MAG: NAD(P)/FAD-dependent oxidoreductase [Bacteroidota bacterium]